MTSEAAAIPQARADARAQDGLAVAALVVIAAALRLVPVVIVPSLNWPDEIFQAVEPAHRLVYGTGLVAWEFQLGVRSWLLPGVVAALMEAARVLGDGPQYYLPVIALAFGLLAAAPVVCCFLWCRRRYGAAAAFAGAMVVATAPDLVYLGARTLSEVVAAHLLVLALFALDRGSRRAVVAGGALLGLTFVLRVQLAPAVALIAAWHLWQRRADGLALLSAAGAVVLAAGLLDWLTLGAPLASVWRYTIVNLADGVAAENGVRAWDFYGMWEFQLWHWALAVPLLLAVLGARRAPLPLLAAIVIVAAHSLIAHKEYRFIYPAILLAMLSAGFGLAEFASRRTAIAGAACAFWLSLATVVWAGPGFLLLRSLGHDVLAASLAVARDPAPCGVGLSMGLGERDWIYGSYTYLHRPVPRYWPKDAADMAAKAPAFDVLIAIKAPPAGYAIEQCFNSVCVSRRKGTCAALPMPPLPLPEALRTALP
jgi:GPI mannosyltransferase 3